MEKAAVKAGLLREMETYFGEDTRRINHAHRVTEYAETLMVAEGGLYPVVIGAAVLHDIGIHEAEKKYGSTSGKYQEKEGPPIARRILTSLGFDLVHINEICDIIAHHHSPKGVSSLNFGILYDADWLVNLGDEYHIRNRDKLSQLIERVFLTQTGKALARKIYLEEA